MTAVFLPLMTRDQPDTAERARLAVYQIPFAIPMVSRSSMEAGLGDQFKFTDECREKGMRRAIEDRIKGAFGCP